MVQIIDLKSPETVIVSNLKKTMLSQGLFYIKNYEDIIENQEIENLQQSFRSFFKLDKATKNKINMKVGGPAWRGWFPLHGELTSGVPDGKEGIYFGREEKGVEGKFMRGENIFLEDEAGSNSGKIMKERLLNYLDKLEILSQKILSYIALALGLSKNYFTDIFSSTGQKPVYLFRAFNYPKYDPTINPSKWGVAEHTDMGFLTLLKQDSSGGLEIFDNNEKSWISAPPIENTFVVNIGDMLERWTHGLFVATRHRVRNTNYDSDRLSMPFFYDPSFNTKLRPIEIENLSDDLQAILKNSDDKSQIREWDGLKMTNLDPEMTYEEYLKSKVVKVFPQLFGSVQ